MLEKQLELDLFVRQGRRLVPTEHAQVLFHYLEPLLVGLDRLPSVAKEIKVSSARPVIVGAEPFMINSFLAEALASYQDNDFINCRVEMCSRGSTSWMAHSNADLGIVLMPFHDTDMNQIKFAELEMVLVLPPSHQLKNKDILSLEDISRYPFIGLSPDSYMQNQLESMVTKSNVKLNTVIETASGIMACELASKGVGVTISDPILAKAYLNRGVTIHRLSMETRLHYAFLLPKERVPSAKVLMLMDRIKDTVYSLGGSYIKSDGQH